jgi:hypothetical protein
MKRIFYHIGGVPPVIKTDNMTAAVSEVLENTERKLTDGFMRFKLHHRFQAEFCNRGAGNEKGNVENKVGYLRRNLLVPVPTIEDFDEFNRELLARCDEIGEEKHYQHGSKINELFEIDKKELLKLPVHEYEVFKYEVSKVDKCGFIKIDTNKYGIAPEYAGEKANVKVYADKIEIFVWGRKTAEYKRSYENNQEISEFQHYLNILSRKPGGIGNIRYWNSFPPVWKKYLENLETIQEKKNAVTILSEIVSDGNKAICDDILKMALERGRSDPDHIRQCYITLSKPEMKPEPTSESYDEKFSGYNPDLSGYDRLSGGVGQ